MRLYPLKYGTENEINMEYRIFNVYELKVSLTWDRYVYRIVRICGTDTLDSLSDLILKSFDFDDEHLYLFEMESNDNCYYKIADFGEKSTDIPIDDLQLEVKQKLVYLYDFGDEWTFSIKVRKVEPTNIYKESTVVESKGTVEQYPGYDDEYEDEIELKILDGLKVIDILNELDDDCILEEYQSLFNYQRPVTGINKQEMRNEIAEEILEYPGYLMLFLPKQQSEYLEAIIHGENIFHKQDRCGLMKLNSFGFCQIKENEYGFTIVTPVQVVNVYKKHMMNSANKKIIENNAELQMITEYLLSKYGVIELESLFETICFITNRKLEYTDFMFFMNSRFHYFGNYIIFTDDDQNQYISLFHEEDALHVLKQRNASKNYRNLSYPIFTIQHCREAIKHNYYMEYEAYKEWWSYLNFDVMLEPEICNALLAITTYAVLIQREDMDKHIKECRELFHQGGCNFTRKAERMIKALSDGLPSAVEKGRTYDEFGNSGMIREGMYNSIEDAKAERKGKFAEKMEKEKTVKGGKEAYEQLTLF
ncbi:MAG: plasmid pRiA4b family protein [Eubacterium sp.]|jgi:hypothetical protein|nr:plasmid pRiA4b family protein [Eubacterium sp.]